MNSPQAPGKAELGMTSVKFPLVGIGASAGGLEALKLLLPGLPAEPGFAVVIILHLSPDQPSSFAEILQYFCKMPVSEVRQHPTEIRPNHVYVIAPGTLLKVEDSYLFLDESRSNHTTLGVIDYFFQSLAMSHRQMAIGLLLSGMGRDGCGGLAAIREQGGATIIQSPQDAEFGVLPQAAIDASQADLVLPAAEIATRLLVLCEGASGGMPSLAQEDEAKAVQEVLEILHQRTGHDFRDYKRPTILRRLERRLHLHGTGSVADYRTLLADDGEEAGKLMKDLLIGVTGFFRDRHAFERLKEVVLPAMLEARADGELRAWVAACSTGQEAYSLAMLLADMARNVPRAPRIHIFASDIDEQALGAARAGLYPESIHDEVPAESLERYFVRSGKQYRVRQALREMITFATHNLLRDPPFSGLDLVTCRNVMIYLDRMVQRRVLQSFHFGLARGGYLFLGSAESADAVPELFAPVDRASRIYRARAVPGWASGTSLAAGAAPAASVIRSAPTAAHPKATLEEMQERLEQAESGCEQLQSHNEVLATINAELEARLDDTSKANDDLNNLIASADLATVIVDQVMVVQRYTPRAAGIFNLIPRDVGRNLLDITHRLVYPQMADDVAHTFESLRPQEREVAGSDGRTYIVRLRPYRTGEDVIVGVVLTFFDVSRRRSAEDEARALAGNQEFQLQLGDRLRPLADPMQILELGCCLLAGHLGVPRLAFAAIRDGRYAILLGHAAGLPPLAGEGELDALEPEALGCWRAGEVLVQHDLAQADGQLAGLAGMAGGSGALLSSVCRKGERWLGFFLACQPAARSWSQVDVILFEEAAERIGVEFERARSQAALLTSDSRLRALLRGCANACWETDGAGQVTQESESWCAYTGQSSGDLLGEGWLDAIHADDRDEVREAWRAAIARGEELDATVCLQRPGGGWQRANILATPLFDDQGDVAKWVGCVIETDEQAVPASGSI